MFWQREKVERKERSDKKVHIQPTISVKLKAEIERLAVILDQPIKDVAMYLYLEAIEVRELNDILAPHFIGSNLQLKNTLYYANDNNKPINCTIKGATDRISIRFDKLGMEDVDLYADLLDVSYSKAVAIVLDLGIRHPGLIEKLLRSHNKRMHFDEVVSAEIKNLMKYIRKNKIFDVDWNPKFVEYINGPKRRIKNLYKKVTPECIDRETYKWDLD